MSSESSSSDSDSSIDEELDNDILKAFQAVKCRLEYAGVTGSERENSQNSAKQKSTCTLSKRHKLIYQTFEKGGLKSNKKCSDHKKIDDENLKSKEKSENFFIDKGPAISAEPDSESGNSAGDIVTYNITSVGDVVESDTEVPDSENVVAYDLTNIDDPVEDSVELNRSVHDSKQKDSENELESEIVQKERKEKNDKKKSRRDNGQLSSQLETDVEVKDVYINVNPLCKSAPKKLIEKQKHKEPEIMKKSVISDDFERQDSIQTTQVSVRQQKKQRKLEREKTKGDKWFNMPATELTEERKYDLQVIQMRKALDPKRFYKAHDLKSAPKYFQFGQVVEDATDFYSSRIPKKQRKSTVVEELLADAEFRKFNKRKYEEVQEQKRLGKGPYKHMKRLKKRKK